MEEIFKAYKFRIYPNKSQQELIQKTFGCCRFVYNNCLDKKIKEYKNNKTTLSKIDLNNYCNRELKKEHEWLKEVDKCALTNAIYNMDSAYQKFFKEHTGYPKFKSKKNNKKSYKTNFTNNNIEVDFYNNKIKLPKLKLVDIKLHRKFSGKIKSVVISQVPSGKYYASILLKTKNTPMNITNNVIGLDLGIKDLVITSNGEKFDNEKLIYKYEKKLTKLQRQLSNKQKGSNNRNKARVKVARLHEKISNTRKDNLNKISHKLICENQVIVSENLNISNMLKNHNLSKSIMDASWYELTRQLKYKSEWNNKKYIKVDTYFASSQLCNVCGYQNKKTKDLNVRNWTCPKCKTAHDRDINSAINILNKGLEMLY